MNAHRSVSQRRGTAATLPTAAQYLPLIDTTRDPSALVPAASLQTYGGPLGKGSYAGARLVGHVYVTGQPVTLGFRILRADGQWVALTAAPDVTIAAGDTQTLSFLFSDYAQDCMVFVLAGATPPTAIHYDLSFVWDRSSGT